MDRPHLPALVGGILPPYVRFPEHIENCSPYSIPLAEMVVRFGVGQKRKRLIQGLLDYRSKLYSIGIVQGAQWIDGSFVEAKKAPNDIDVVTFFRRPSTHINDKEFQQLVDENGNVFDSKPVRDKYHCDAYIVDLDADSLEVARQAHFWGGLFGHQRKTFKRKGFLQVSLNELEDQEALAALQRTP